MRHATLVVVGFVLLVAWVFARPLFSGRLLAESDLFDQYLPLFRSPALVWSSFEFAGVPAFADPENSEFYPARWLFAHVYHSWNGFIVSAFVFAGCFTYAYLYFHTRSRAAATFGAVGFVLSEAMLERVPHANILHAIVWVPLLLLALDAMLVSRRWLLWLAAASFAGASCVLAGHPQFAVYAAYVCGAYALVGLIADRAPWTHWLRVVGAAAVALLLSAVSLIPLVEMSNYSVRQPLDFPEFVTYSNSPWQMLSALFPVIAHPGLEAPTYAGLLVLFLAGVGATQLRSNWRVGFWIVVAVGGLVLGAGDATPLASLVFHLPLYDHFRIVARHLVFAVFALNVLAAFGFVAFAQARISRRTLAVASGVFALLLLTGAVLLVWRPEAVRFDHVDESFPLPWVVDRVWIQAAVGAVSLAVVPAMWRYPASRVAASLAIIVLAADLLHASSYQVGAAGLRMVTVPTDAATPGVHARRLRARLEASGQRFIAVPDSLRDDVVPGLFSRSWGMANAGGYTSLLLKNVSALTSISANGRVERAALSAEDAGLDLLAVRYVVARADALQPPLDSTRWRDTEQFSTSRTTDRKSDENVQGEDHYVVYENQRALPRAWLATEVLPTTDGVMSDAVRTSQLRGRGRFDPRATALVFEGEAPAANYQTGGSANLSSIADSRITVEVSSPGGGFVVLSEAYYPGWQARIDGNAAQPVHRTDLAIQGITVPAGPHVVTFEFASRTRRVGFGLGAAGVLALIATLIVGWRTLRL